MNDLWRSSESLEHEYNKLDNVDTRELHELHVQLIEDRKKEIMSILYERQLKRDEWREERDCYE